MYLKKWNDKGILIDPLIMRYQKRLTNTLKLNLYQEHRDFSHNNEANTRKINNSWCKKNNIIIKTVLNF